MQCLILIAAPRRKSSMFSNSHRSLKFISFDLFRAFFNAFSFHISPVLKPVSNLKFCHFQSSRQQRALVSG